MSIKNDIEAQFKKLYEYYNVLNDNQLSKKLGYKSNSAVSNWRTENKIPDKYSFIVNSISSDANVQEDLVYLRYFENVTAAGYGSNNDNEVFTPIPVSPEFIRNVLGIPSSKNYDMIRIIGDSMEPFASSGDIVVIDKLVEPKNGDMVIANINGDVYMKKFLRNPVKKEVKLTSLNDFYQDITLSGDELEYLKIVGKVKCKFNINMKVY